MLVRYELGNDGAYARSELIISYLYNGEAKKPKFPFYEISNDRASYQGDDPVVFPFNGVAYILLGCRVYTLREAYLHWGEAARHVTLNRQPRALAMIDHVLPKADRIAKRRKWKDR